MEHHRPARGSTRAATRTAPGTGNGPSWSTTACGRNIPDLDGITQLANPDLRLPPAQHVDVVPEGALFPFCIMNVAFRAEAAPLMYMLLMGQDQHGERWGFDRFDDIWGGLLVKRAADHLGWAVTSGAPSIHHSRASDPHRNAELEAAGMDAHEDFWPYIAAVPPVRHYGGRVLPGTR